MEYAVRGALGGTDLEGGTGDHEEMEIRGLALM